MCKTGEGRFSDASLEYSSFAGWTSHYLAPTNLVEGLGTVRPSQKSNRAFLVVDIDCGSVIRRVDR